MGCSHFNPRNFYLESLFDNPVDWRLELMEDKSLMEDTIYTMKQIENVRDIMDQLDNLIIVTGGYCFPSPGVGVCIKSVLIKVAYDNDGETQSRITAHTKKPYLEIKGGKLSEEGEVVASTLVTFLNNLYLQKERDKFYILEEKLKTLRDGVKNGVFSTKNTLLVEVALNCFVQLEHEFDKMIENCDEELRNIEDNIAGARSIARQAKFYKKKSLHDIICISQKDNKGHRGLANEQRGFYKNKLQVKTRIKVDLYKIIE
jgi:hypothetical protein